MLTNNLVATDFADKTAAQIATVLISNLGLSSVACLNKWLTAQITAAGAAGRGAKIVSLLDDFSNLTYDATYDAAASSLNTKVDADYGFRICSKVFPAKLADSCNRACAKCA